MDDQYPLLCEEVNKGFVGLKSMLRTLLQEGKASGELGESVDADAVTELLFAGMIGASVSYGVNKSPESLDSSVGALINYLEQQRP